MGLIHYLTIQIKTVSLLSSTKFLGLGVDWKVEPFSQRVWFKKEATRQLGKRGHFSKSILLCLIESRRRAKRQTMINPCWYVANFVFGKVCSKGLARKDSRPNFLTNLKAQVQSVACNSVLLALPCALYHQFFIRFHYWLPPVDMFLCLRYKIIFKRNFRKKKKQFSNLILDSPAWPSF